jgi:hypothetical protein
LLIEAHSGKANRVIIAGPGEEGKKRRNRTIFCNPDASAGLFLAEGVSTFGGREVRYARAVPHTA